LTILLLDFKILCYPACQGKNSAIKQDCQYCKIKALIFDFGVGCLTGPPARLCSPAGQYDNPMLESTTVQYVPQSGTKNLATELLIEANIVEILIPAAGHPGKPKLRSPNPTNGPHKKWMKVLQAKKLAVLTLIDG
jgi:hypothetical protein